MRPPIPILATPTTAARKAFLQAVYAAGFNWCGGRRPLEEYDDSSYQHAYLRLDDLYVDRGPSILFTDWPKQITALLEDGTLVNSPRQFISYVKRHDWRGDPTT